MSTGVEYEVVCRESISVTTDIFLHPVTWVCVVGLSIGVRSHAGVARAIRLLQSVSGGDRVRPARLQTRRVWRSIILKRNNSAVLGFAHAYSMDGDGENLVAKRLTSDESIFMKCRNYLPLQSYKLRTVGNDRDFSVLSPILGVLPLWDRCSLIWPTSCQLAKFQQDPLPDCQDQAGGNKSQGQNNGKLAEVCHNNYINLPQPCGRL